MVDKENIKRWRFDKKIYVSHIFQGKDENVKRIENIVKTLVKEHPNFMFVSPVHCTGFLYDCTEYEQGLSMTIELLKMCDEIWVFDDYSDSEGVNYEIEYAKEHNIPIKKFPKFHCF